MRILRGLGALIALAVLLAGIPVCLATFGGNPLPTDWSWQAIGQALLRPASDRALIGLVTIAGWIVWAALVASVTAEVLNALPGRRRRRLQLQIPGLGIGQKLAAALIVAVVSMLAAPHVQPVAHAEPAQPAPVATAPAHASSTASTTGAPSESTKAPAADRRSPQVSNKQQSVQRHKIHVVKRGEWLWNLAEHYLGEGSRWKEIAAANPGIDPDRIDVGQRLRIPLDRDPQPASNGKQTHEKRVSPKDGDTVTVQRGDSLSAISEDLYGDAKHWPDLYQANKASISDPDEIEIGQQLQLPSRRVLADSDRTVHHAPKQHRDDSDQPSMHKDGEARKGSDAPAKVRQDRPVPEAPAATPAPEVTRPAQPAPASPVETTTRPAEPTAEIHASEGIGQIDPQSVAAVSVGLLLAAGLITSLNSRRRRQLHSRKPGRQVPRPSAAASSFEQEVVAKHQPLRFEHLDLVTRAIAAHCRRTGDELPALTAARVADDRIDLLLSRPAASPPAGIEAAADGSVWTVHVTDLAAIRAIDGVADTVPPYPALVTLGRDADTAHVLIDLEAAAALTIAADDADEASRMMATIALELALSPWSADLDVTFVGPMLPGFTEGLDHPAVTQIDDIDRVLTGLEHRAAARRNNLAETTLGQKRLDPDLADAWCPHVVLFGQELDSDQARRLAGVVTELPRVAIAAVTTYEALTTWRCDLQVDGTAHLSPFDWDLTPQLVTDEQYQQLLELVTISGTDETRPAPWWDHDVEPAEGPAPAATVTPLPATASPVATSEPEEEQLPIARVEADDETHIGSGSTPVARPNHLRSRPGPRSPLTLHALVAGDGTDRVSSPVGRASAGSQRPDANDGDAWMALTSPPAADRPMLRLIGEPELVGARGPTNRRYKQRTLEIMFYLLEHPGTTMPGLTGTFSLSRDYAKSLVSNLRKTLGANDSGELYLPEMGQRPGYRLHDEVTCDIYYVNQLIGRGVNTAPSEILIRILAVVRGEPFLGADDWKLGFNLHAVRADVSCKLTDAAHELTGRALADGNIKLARWATAQGRAADPLNQTLMADEVRIEIQAGNTAVVTRLADRMSATARELDADLSDDAKEVLRDAIAM